jgi:NAD(P)-dependent dehydrogenase (short-subunit alcohol dehydrogenase family)
LVNRRYEKMGMLDGKVVVITGAGRGLGRNHALFLANEGAKIVVNDLGVEWDGTGEKALGPADEVVKEIKDAGGEAVANGDSVTDFQGAKRMVECAIDTFGKLDAFINNAGFLRDRMSFKMSQEEWDAVIGVHLTGTFYCCRHAAEYFRGQSKAGTPVNGRIINTISHAGLIGSAGQCNYTAAKAGIAGLTLALARELERYNTTVNAVAPMARTRMTTNTENPAVQAMFAKPEDEDKFDEMAPENISPVVAYLASDNAQDISGRVFASRGGRLELLQTWQSENVIDNGKKWTVEEIDKKIRDLGTLSIPEMWF